MFIDHKPDFKEKVNITYLNKTDIFSAIYGVEQRAATRENPRIVMTYKLTTTGNDIYKRRFDYEKELINDCFVPLYPQEFSLVAPNRRELRAFPWSLRHFRSQGYVQVLIDGIWTFKTIVEMDYDADSILLEPDTLPSSATYKVRPVIKARREGDNFNFEDNLRKTRTETVVWKEVY